MQREAKFYAVYALMSVALFLYATSFSLHAWERFGPSGTFAVFVGTSLLLAAFAALGAWLAFIFYARSLVSLRRVSGGFELLPAKHPTPQPIRVRQLRHIRTIGQQFSKDESVPAFAIIAAGGKVWVADASSYQAANAATAQ